MSTPNVEPVTPVTTEVTTTEVVAPTTDEVKDAVSKGASTLPENPTGKDFAEMINALPERIVDALREATATPSGASTTAGTTPPASTTPDPKGGPWFGHATFAEFWNGKSA